MSDLISRSALLKLFEDKMFNDKLMNPVIKMSDVIEIIEEQPIAYDKEAVVEQLENASFWEGYSYDEDGYSNDTEYEAIGLYRAIEIVRKSGVNE